MEIPYNITFHSNWHCDSGLASGAHLDALVIKDKNGMPYIPGKTLKGIIKEAVYTYISFTTKVLIVSDNYTKKNRAKTVTVTNTSDSSCCVRFISLIQIRSRFIILNGTHSHKSYEC